MANATNIDGKVIKSSKKERERLMNANKDNASLTRKGRTKNRSKSKSPSTSRSRSGSRKGRLKKKLSNSSIKSTGNLPSKRPTRFKISFDSSSDPDTEEENDDIDGNINMPSEGRDEKEDPGVVNPVFVSDEEDDVSRGDVDGTSELGNVSSLENSPPSSPRSNFRYVPSVVLYLSSCITYERFLLLQKHFLRFLK